MKLARLLVWWAFLALGLWVFLSGLGDIVVWPASYGSLP
jgi:hypothetical protein